VSLSPALTETLFVLGFDAEVVGVSDYCHEPPAVETRPRVGTIFSPRFEAIVQTRPTLLVSERIAGTRIEDLEKLAKTETFPWLSFDDVMQSTHALGQLLDRVPAAEHLVENYQRVLDVTPVPSPPRVLLALAHVPGQLSEIWFIRRNSLHGRALEAAGATNAITRDVFGPPRVGIEEVIALDPDAIVVVEPVAEAHLELLQDWRRIAALKAVQNGRLSLIAAPELDVPGPRIVRFVSRLREAIAAMRLGDTTTDRAHGAALEKGRTP
jgi:iron complex transport system substrate-binding protein